MVKLALARLKKVPVDIQPVFVRTDERIEAHVMMCMLAYLLERWSEMKTGLSFQAIRRLLKAVHATQLIQKSGSVWKPGNLAPEQSAIYKALDVPAPKSVLHVGELARLSTSQM